MEASTLHAPARLARLSAGSPLLRLRTDEQLVSLLRQGSQEAFRVIHDRYRQRLFAYIRQMLGATSRQDAEDVLQDVFARAYTALRADRRAIHLRPWLYRVAHNRCIDYHRRETPPTSELFEAAGKPLHDPFEDVQRREDLQRLVVDIGRLPDQQRSALLMREMGGMSYRELADALDVTVAAVKSLLVRARVELVETIEARDVACVEIREQLLEAYDDRLKVSPQARRHVRDCGACAEYRAALGGMKKSFAALSPIAVAGPLALIGKLAGLGGSGGGASASGGAASGGSLVAGLTATTAGKVAVVATTAAITAGGAVGIEKEIAGDSGSSSSAAQQASAPSAPVTPFSTQAPIPTATGTRAATSGASTSPTGGGAGRSPGGNGGFATSTAPGGAQTIFGTPVLITTGTSPSGPATTPVSLLPFVPSSYQLPGSVGGGNDGGPGSGNAGGSGPSGGGSPADGGAGVADPGARTGDPDRRERPRIRIELPVDRLDGGNRDREGSRGKPERDDGEPGGGRPEDAGRPDQSQGPGGPESGVTEKLKPPKLDKPPKAVGKPENPGRPDHSRRPIPTPETTAPSLGPAGASPTPAEAVTPAATPGNRGRGIGQGRNRAVPPVDEVLENLLD